MVVAGTMIVTAAALAQARSPVAPSGDLSGMATGIAPQERSPVPGANAVAPSGTGIGAAGTSPGYGGNAGAASTTGNTMGTGTGVGIGNTSIGQSTVQSPVGAPDAASKTPGGPPDPNGINMSGTGTNSAAER